MDQLLFFHSLCLMGMMITLKGVTGIDLSISYPNTISGACMNDIATATCAVISSHLQWRVNDDQSGTEYFNYLLTTSEDRIGDQLFSMDNVTVFQNKTVTNNSDIAQSLITSELRLSLSSNRPSVTITCSDTLDTSRDEKVQARLLDDPPPPPIRLSQLGGTRRSVIATVYFIWEPPPSFERSDIAEYILTATAAVGAQSQSKLIAVTGSSLELSTSINYSITVQQRTKCMDVSDSAMIPFEPIRDSMSTMERIMTMEPTSTTELMPMETTAFEPSSKCNCSSIKGLESGIGILAAIVLLLMGCLIVVFVYLVYKKYRLATMFSLKHSVQEQSAGEIQAEMVPYRISMTGPKSVAND